MYELYLTDPLGALRLAVLDSYSRLEWTRKLNDVGWLTLTFGNTQEDWRLFAPDRRVEVWRVSDIPKLVEVYYLLTSERGTDAQGRAAIVWQGATANHLLTRRIVAFDAGSASADKTDFADDLLKAYAYENLGAGAVAARSITAMGFAVAADLSQGPSLSYAASRKKLLDALQAICQASVEAGTRLYFDIVHPTTTTLLFRTYITMRGTDHTTVVAPFSLLRGSLAAPVRIVRDWREECNYIYVGGQGTEDDREIVTASDAVAIGASLFGRKEMMVDGRSYEDAAELATYGQRTVTKNAAKRTFEAVLIDAPGSRFQQDWDLGDLVLAEYDDEVFECEVDGIHGTASTDAERIEAKLASID